MSKRDAREKSENPFAEDFSGGGENPATQNANDFEAPGERPRKKACRSESAEAKRPSKKGSKTAKAKRSPSKKKKSSVSRFFKKLGKQIKRLFNDVVEWASRSRRNKIIAISSASAAALLIVGGIVLAILGAGGDTKPKMQLELVEEEVAANYSFVDASEYAGTLLETTEDAGVEYLEETLFVGDSNMARMVMYGLLDYSNVIGIESMGIQGVTSVKSVYFSGYDEPVTIPTAISLMKPRRIIFNFGTNNLLGTSTEDFIESYNAALAAIEEAYPYSDIIIMAIHPLGQNRSNTALTQSQVDDYNLALINYARDAGYPFLDTAEVLKDEDGWLKEKFAYSDGIHLTSEALQTVLSYARTHAHIVEDARPQPIGSVPTQVAPPARETEADFDPALVASAAQSIFTSNGFTLASGHSGTATVNWSWVWPTEGAEGGTEETVAQNLYSSYLASYPGVTSGQVLISYSTSGSEYVFSVQVYPAAAAHTHSYTYTSNNNGTHNAVCANTDGACTVKTITNEACTYGSFTTNGTTCSRTCTMCGYVDTHASVAGAFTVDVAATETTAGSQHWLCQHSLTGGGLCGAKYTEAIPATGATHTHSYTWVDNGNGTHTGTCTGAGTCDAQTVTEDHTWGAWTDSGDGTNHSRTCSKCGASETAAHSFSGGSCSVCAAAEPVVVVTDPPAS
ncbi:MAG: GDSL-type esterase/lipase family protein [Oscillospiraceae bacterium]|nr:GDSL-type esterase/lipase family protein [Oscillospiraceae bacterium]